MRQIKLTPQGSDDVDHINKENILISEYQQNQFIIVAAIFTKSSNPRDTP